MQDTNSNIPACLQDLPPVLSVDDLCKIVGMPRSTVGDQIRRGRLKALNLCPGTRPKYRLLRDDVIAWMTANPVDPIYAEGK